MTICEELDPWIKEMYIHGAMLLAEPLNDHGGEFYYDCDWFINDQFLPNKLSNLLEYDERINRGFCEYYLEGCERLMNDTLDGIAKVMYLYPAELHRFIGRWANLCIKFGIAYWALRSDPRFKLDAENHGYHLTDKGRRWVESQPDFDEVMAIKVAREL